MPTNYIVGQLGLIANFGLFNDFYVFHGSSTWSYLSYHYYLGWLWSLFLILEYDCIPQRQKFWRYVIGVFLKLKPPTLIESDTISEYQKLMMMLMLMLMLILLSFVLLSFETHLKEYETRLEEWESIQSKILTWFINTLPLLTISSHPWSCQSCLGLLGQSLQLY